MRRAKKIKVELFHAKLAAGERPEAMNAVEMKKLYRRWQSARSMRGIPYLSCKPLETRNTLSAYARGVE